MGFDRSHRSFRVMLAQGLDHRRVFGAGGFLVDGLELAIEAAQLHMHVERTVGGEQKLVVRSRHQELMKSLVQLVELAVAVGPGARVRMGALLEDPFHGQQIGHPDAPGGELGGVHFQQAAHMHQIHHLLRGQQGAHAEALERLEGDQPLRSQPHQRLAHRGRAEVQVGSQAIDIQALARQIDLVHDALFEGVINSAGEHGLLVVLHVETPSGRYRIVWWEIL